MQTQHPSFLPSEFILVFLISLSPHLLIFIHSLIFWVSVGNAPYQSILVGKWQWEEFNSTKKTSSFNIFPDISQSKRKSPTSPSEQDKDTSEVSPARSRAAQCAEASESLSPPPKTGMAARRHRTFPHRAEYPEPYEWHVLEKGTGCVFPMVREQCEYFLTHCWWSVLAHLCI